ncbi:hypothetical protein AAE478_001384 [Parahypoxylon ruwenzoriense]
MRFGVPASAKCEYRRSQTNLKSRQALTKANTVRISASLFAAFAALLLNHYCAAGHSQGIDSPPAERTYVPCEQGGYRAFPIRNFRGVTRGPSDNETETFSFQLSANFSGYSSFGAWFDYASNEFLGLNHTFVCDRSPGNNDPARPYNKLANAIATGNGCLAVSLVGAPEGPLTVSEGDNVTIAAYTKVVHPLPLKAYGAASA